MNLFYAFLINFLLIGLSVVIHYEMLYLLAKKMASKFVIPRYRILIGIFVILCAHIIEVWLFAFGYYVMINLDGFGSLSGNFNQSLLDCAYYSFTSYTTLGFGDIMAQGHIRFLSGLEALLGLVLITWSASFLFIEMQYHWPERK